MSRRRHHGALERVHTFSEKPNRPQNGDSKVDSWTDIMIQKLQVSHSFNKSSEQGYKKKLETGSQNNHESCFHRHTD